LHSWEVEASELKEGWKSTGKGEAGTSAHQRMGSNFLVSSIEGK
jgi:hypothetical protein